METLGHTQCGNQTQTKNKKNTKTQRHASLRQRPKTFDNWSQGQATTIKYWADKSNRKVPERKGAFMDTLERGLHIQDVLNDIVAPQKRVAGASG